jgi:hypothetical protein
VEKKIDLDWLLRLRLVVARYGEMDALKWWNTNGQLGLMAGKCFAAGSREPTISRKPGPSSLSRRPRHRRASAGLPDTKGDSASQVEWLKRDIDPIHPSPRRETGQVASGPDQMMNALPLTISSCKSAPSM